MGYLFLALSVFMGTAKGFCGKKTSVYADNTLLSLFISILRMFFCVIIGFVVVIVLQGTIKSFAIDLTTFIISMISGVATSVFVVSWLLAVRNGAYMMLDVFLTLGTSVPLVLSAVLFGENIVWLKWVGLALLITASFIMFSYNSSLKGKVSIKGMVLLIVCCLSNGTTQFAQKWFNVQMSERELIGGLIMDATTYNFYTYVFSFVCILLCFFVLKIFAKRQEPTEIQTNAYVKVFKKTWVYVLIMAFCLFMHTYFATLSANYLPSSELFPMQRGASLILSLAMSAVFFKERINSKCMNGVIITFIGLLLINVFAPML